MQRRVLLAYLVALAFIACIGIAAVLVGSLGPSAKTDAALPRVPTSHVMAGAFLFVPDIYGSTPIGGEVLLIRLPSGRLDAWYIPTRSGVRSLPDGSWWRPGLPCQDLAPDFERGFIHCRDRPLPDWALALRWTLEGKSLSSHAPDMQRVPGTEEGGFFVFHKRSAA